jgi:pimeloyl-ACP methyl ester carboxylesterase
MLAPIVDQIAAALPAAKTHLFQDAGHIPHVSHPTDSVAMLRGFIATG